MSVWTRVSQPLKVRGPISFSWRNTWNTYKSVQVYRWKLQSNSTRPRDYFRYTRNIILTVKLYVIEVSFWEQKVDVIFLRYGRDFVKTVIVKTEFNCRLITISFIFWQLGVFVFNGISIEKPCLVWTIGIEPTILQEREGWSKGPQKI